MTKRVGVIFGGKSGEHEVSLVSAVNLINEIDREEFKVVPILIEKTGQWKCYEAPNHKITNVLELVENKKMNPYDLKENVDVVFPVIHGETGEDGKLQGLLEMYDIPYVGCGVEASVIGMNKRLTKDEMAGYMNVVDSISIKKSENFLDGISKGKYTMTTESVVANAERSLNYPMFVKPSRAGSSLGTNKVSNRKELLDALEEAFKIDELVLIEEFIKMVELEVAVFDDGEILHISDVGHIDYDAEFYDYVTKYEGNDSVMIIPAKVDDEISRVIKEYAGTAFNVLGVKDYARIDFFYDVENSEIYFNEINTSPGMTSKSMYPFLFKSKFEFGYIVNTLLRKNLGLGK